MSVSFRTKWALMSLSTLLIAADCGTASSQSGANPLFSGPFDGAQPAASCGGQCLPENDLGQSRIASHHFQCGPPAIATRPTGVLPRHSSSGSYTATPARSSIFLDRHDVFAAQTIVRLNIVGSCRPSSRYHASYSIMFSIGKPNALS